MSYRIVSYESNQEWLDAFNEFSGNNFKMNEAIHPDVYDPINTAVLLFNHEVAEGGAIRLEKIDEAEEETCDHTYETYIVQTGSSSIDIEQAGFCTKCGHDTHRDYKEYTGGD